jgi:hypothetical protein
MMVALLLAGLLQNSQGLKTQRIDLEAIGLSFDAPVTWKLSKKKIKKEMIYTLTLPGQTKTGQVVISPTTLSQDKAEWMSSLKMLWETNKDENITQAEEEILGVPLLVTKANYYRRSEFRTKVNGLLYANTPRLMVYNMDCLDVDYSTVDKAWRDSLQTLRPFRAEQKLEPYDPARAPKIDPKNPELLPVKPPQVVTVSEMNSISKPVLAPKKADLKVANRNVSFHFPADWTSAVETDGSVTLTHKDSGSVQISLFSTLDSEPVDRALASAAAKALEEFEKVTQRIDGDPVLNRAAAFQAWIWRDGSTKSGPLHVGEGVVLKGDFYAVIRFRSTAKVADRRLLTDLLEAASIEVQP